MKKVLEPFGSCLLNSTASPAHFHPNWAGLPLLFSKQIPNGSHDFSYIFTIFFFSFFRYQTIEAHALGFLTHISLAIVGVDCLVHVNCKHKNFWNVFSPCCV